MQMMWPILVVVGANTFYNICAKSMPETINPFFSLAVTYAIATVISVAAFLISSHGKNIGGEFAKINWTTIVFGICIFALEFGYLNIYRVGWNINTAPMVANIMLAVILLIIGAIFFKETLTVRKVAGVAVCAAGLILIGK